MKPAFSALALLAALALIGGGQAQSQTRDNAPEGQYSAAAVVMFKPLGRVQVLSRPHFEITALELGYDIGNDEEAATKMFLGRDLRISGAADWRAAALEGGGLPDFRQTAVLGQDPGYVPDTGFRYLPPEQYGDQPDPGRIRGEEFRKKYPNFRGFKYSYIYYYLDPDQGDLAPEAVAAMIRQSPFTVGGLLLERVEANKRPGVCLLY